MTKPKETSCSKTGNSDNVIIKSKHNTVIGREIELHAWPMYGTKDLRVVVYGPQKCAADFTLTEQNLVDMLSKLRESKADAENTEEENHRICCPCCRGEVEFIEECEVENGSWTESLWNCKQCSIEFAVAKVKSDEEDRQPDYEGEWPYADA